MKNLVITALASAVLAGIELMHMIRKGQHAPRKFVPNLARRS
ncbi:transposase [Rhodoferax ferrireducens]|nr:transposase [Rhodoferax ferrireducens]